MSNSLKKIHSETIRSRVLFRTKYSDGFGEFNESLSEHRRAEGPYALQDDRLENFSDCWFSRRCNTDGDGYPGAIWGAGLAPHNLHAIEHRLRLAGDTRS